MMYRIYLTTCVHNASSFLFLLCLLCTAAKEFVEIPGLLPAARSKALAHIKYLEHFIREQTVEAVSS